MNDVQKGPASGLPGLFVRVRRQSRQPKPVAFCGSESKRGLCLKTALSLAPTLFEKDGTVRGYTHFALRARARSRPPGKA